MNRTILISMTALIFFVACARAQQPEAATAEASEGVPITFVLEAPANSAPVYLTGNLEELGPWDPAKKEMTFRDGKFTTTLAVPAGTEIEYKFTRGSWDKEALNPDGSVPGNRTHTVEGAATLHDSVPLFRGLDADIPYPDPTRWEDEIRAFEQLDMRARYAANSVVAVGSSSMRMWHDSIESDLDPLRIIPRGFGGSMMNDALYYADRIVLKYNPQTVLLYEGDNDIAHGVQPETILDTFQAFCKKIWDSREDTHIYVLSTKPSPNREQFWPKMQELNDMLAAECAKDDRLIYIDVATPMLTEDGKMRPELYRSDMLHMNENGYAIWTRVVRDAMLEAEASR
ncbi:hypothetical protein KQI84_14575 [bacterium]|nr:hypothetical protein [bacterium]